MSDAKPSKPTSRSRKPTASAAPPDAAPSVRPAAPSVPVKTQSLRTAAARAKEPVDEKEPLSLAEEALQESSSIGEAGDETNQRYERVKKGEIHIAELQRMPMGDLIEQAKAEGIKDFQGIKKQDLIFAFSKSA